MIKVLLDADACPVSLIVENACENKQIPLVAVCDHAHLITLDYGEVIRVDKGADSADFALVNRANKGDIVLSNDYGLLCMALSKGAKCMLFSGRIVDENNIDSLLAYRHLGKKERQEGRYSGRMKKRTLKDDAQFKDSFLRLLENLL